LLKKDYFQDAVLASVLLQQVHSHLESEVLVQAQPVPATTRSRLRPPVPQANIRKSPEPTRSKSPIALTSKITPKNQS
jgi:hypothetical protein